MFCWYLTPESLIPPSCLVSSLAHLSPSAVSVSIPGFGVLILFASFPPLLGCHIALHLILASGSRVLCVLPVPTLLPLPHGPPVRAASPPSREHPELCA